MVSRNSLEYLFENARKVLNKFLVVIINNLFRNNQTNTITALGSSGTYRANN